jgi:hypothetical protein
VGPGKGSFPCFVKQKLCLFQATDREAQQIVAYLHPPPGHHAGGSSAEERPLARTTQARHRRIHAQNISELVAEGEEGSSDEGLSTVLSLITYVVPFLPIIFSRPKPFTFQ